MPSSYAVRSRQRPRSNRFVAAPVGLGDRVAVRIQKPFRMVRITRHFINGPAGHVSRLRSISFEKSVELCSETVNLV